MIQHPFHNQLVKKENGLTGSEAVAVGAPDDEVGAEAIEVATVLRIVDVVFEKHLLHPVKKLPRLAQFRQKGLKKTQPVKGTSPNESGTRVLEW